MVTTALTPAAAPPPHHRRDDEPIDAHALFLRWWSTSPRPELANPHVLELAYRHQWRARAAALDRKFEAARPLAHVVEGIALDAVTVLSVELEQLAIECRANPGRQRLKDLTPLLAVLGQLGGLQPAANAARAANAEDDVDYSTLDADELETLARASAILAKAKRRRV